VTLSLLFKILLLSLPAGRGSRLIHGGEALSSPEGILSYFLFFRGRETLFVPCDA